jgi:hypothetical protein
MYETRARPDTKKIRPDPPLLGVGLEGSKVLKPQSGLTG